MKNLIAALMSKSHLLSACIIFASLAGFTQSASATTLFGIKFDFQSMGQPTGGAFIQFAVAPLSLPFDQWIDISSATDLKVELWVEGGFLGSASIFRDTDLVVLNLEVYVADLNPLFTVQLRPHVPGGIYLLNFVDPGNLSRNFQLFNNGGYDYSPGGGHFSGTWTASMWFDDPIPAVIPIPAAVWLFGSGLGLLGWMKRKRA